MGKIYREKLVGVFGYPVDENPSVVLHESGFAALGLPFRYLTVEVKPGDLKAAIAGMRAMNMKGGNITMPFKTEVIDYLDEVAEDALVMNAVNTIYERDGKYYGENTDGKGFMMALNKGGVSLEGKKAVMLGAGGAAGAIVVELANAGVKEIVVVNRSAERGEALVKRLNDKTSAHAEFVKWDSTYKIPADTDIVVNGTSIGFASAENDKPDIDYDTITAGMTVCDVVPDLTTPFLKEAEKRGARTFEGITMLINQGVLAFEFWTQTDAPYEVMSDAIKKEFGLI